MCNEKEKISINSINVNGVNIINKYLESINIYITKILSIEIDNIINIKESIIIIKYKDNNIYKKHSVIASCLLKFIKTLD